MASFGPPQSTNPAAAVALDLDTLIRSVLFVAVFLAVATSFHPFPDLSAPPDITDAGDRLNQIGFSLLFVATGAWVFFNNPGRLWPLLRPALLVVLSWCALTVLTSWEPSLAARRFVYALVIMSIAAMLLLLPKNLRHFADLLAVVALIVLVLCYLGVVFAPNLSIHQTSDFVEPDLAGDWRGLFAHKNEAGAVMALFIFVGLFVARARSVFLGVLVIALAVPFLIFTRDKTALTLLLPVLLISFVIGRFRRPAIGIAVTLSILLAMNLFSVGSLYLASVRDVLGALLPDPSFTGRTDIWQFALQHVAQRPITGYGFAAFWGTQQVVYGMGGNSIWANAAAQAHNSYVNLALTIGVPGSALVAFWLIVLPLADYYRGSREPATEALRLLLLRICLYGACASCFESIYFQMGDIWFMLLIAVFGLRLLSVSRLRA